MSSFDFSASPHPVRADIGEAQRAFFERLAGPGSCWTGEQRIAIAREARQARPVRSEPPWLRKLPEPDAASLPLTATEAVRTVSLDAQKLDRDWAERTIAELGDAAYVELVAITVQITAIDAFAEALGVEPELFRTMGKPIPSYDVLPITAPSGVSRPPERGSQGFGRASPT